MCVGGGVCREEVCVGGGVCRVWVCVGGRCVCLYQKMDTSCLI